MFISTSMPQVCPGSWWEIGFTWLSSGRCQRSRRGPTQKRTAWLSLRSVRCATSTSSSPSQNCHALCWWGMGWRNSGGPTEVSWFCIRMLSYQECILFILLQENGRSHKRLQKPHSLSFISPYFDVVSTQHFRITCDKLKRIVNSQKQ